MGQTMRNFDKKLAIALGESNKPSTEGVLDNIMKETVGSIEEPEAKNDLSDVSPDDIKKATQAQGAGNEAEKLQDELEKEKEEKETRDAQFKKEFDPLSQQTDQNLQDISTEIAAIAANQENMALDQENIAISTKDLEDNKSELASIIDQISEMF